MMPTVSVCIPTYQGARFLAETLDTVLAQDGIDFEIVVCDNASTDGTAEILAGYHDSRLRIVTNASTLDLAANWRRAVEAARGELVKVVCADDLLSPGCLRAQADVLLRRPDVALVASRRAVIDADGRILLAAIGLRGLVGDHDGAHVSRAYVRCGGINLVGEPAAVMFRRADYERVGGWDGRFVYPMDMDLWLKLLRLGGFVGQPEVYAAFRMSGSNLSASHSRAQFGEVKALLGQVSHADGSAATPMDRMAGFALRRFVWEAALLRRRSHRPGPRWLDAGAG